MPHPDSPQSRSLPMAGAHAGRTFRTCELKCGSACFHDAPNASANAYFGDVVEQQISRRSLLRGTTAAVVLGTVGGSAVNGAVPAAAAPGRAGDSGTGLSFDPIPPTDFTVDELIVPDEYAYDVLIRWGDPVIPGAPRFDVDNQTAATQAQQFGYNCDFIGFFPLGPGRGPAASSRGVMGINHEYTIPEIMFPEGSYDPENPTREQVDVEIAAHGFSVLEVQRQRRSRGPYTLRVASPLNRRFTGETEMVIAGPAAGHDWLRTSEDPTGTVVRGTLNNCAGGKTPWGTVLTGEENFNQYFANADQVTDPEVRDVHARYGLPEGASARKWERYHDRFDLAKEPHEPFRFGWVVEIDPDDPTWTPHKRTALGRFKHEAATTSLAEDGRVVAYSGDDETFEYVYKFVSRDTYRPGDTAHNRTLLDDGDLYVARFTGDSPQSEIERYNNAATLGTLPEDGEFDGVGRWLPLVQDGQSAVAGWSVAEVLIDTRGAADVAGATKMDRPEDTQRNPVNGRVYLAMTNNTERGVDANPGVDEPNPRKADSDGTITGNKYGHVVEVTEDGNDGAAETFSWRLFLVCGDPSDPTTYFAGFDPSQVSPIACPDNVAFDQAGNLWLATDGQQGTIGKADAFHAVPVRGRERGRVRQYLSVPAGAEACGPEFTPDGRALFCSVQHPGDPGVAPGLWPDGVYPPRPSVVTTYRAKGNPRVGA